MKKQIKVVLGVAAVAVIIAAVLIIQGNKALEIIGDKDIVLNLGSPYIEEGTNIRKAEVNGDVDTSQVGNYTITYTYKDKQAVRNVHVVDPDSLVMGLRGSENTKVCQDEPYIESGAFAIDRTTGKISECEVSGKVDTSKSGTYEVIYTLSSGYLQKSLTRQVEVVPKEDFAADADGISVLMYHYVYTENDKPSSLNSNYISDKNLEAQLKYLTENDYYFPSFKELRAFADGVISLPEKSVILTFDDGQMGFLAYGLPLLNKYKVPATSFIIGVNNGENKIKEYASQYVCFESHSYNMHRAGGNIGHGGVISAMTKEQIKTDLKKEAELIGSRDAFAYPYGDVTEDAKAAVAETEILCAFTTAYGKVRVGDDFRGMSRVRVQGEVSLDSYKDIL